MLKRCSPRSRTSAVSGNGSASASAAPFFPVKKLASSCSVPRAMVPSTSGRALEASLKNMLSRSGWPTGVLCMSCRHPPLTIAAPSRQTAASRPETDIGPRTPVLGLRFDFIDLTRIERLEKIQRLRAIELRIGRLDQQKELVPAGVLEARHVEDRVIRLRQPVQHDHPEHRGDRGEEDRQLEH